MTALQIILGVLIAIPWAFLAVIVDREDRRRKRDSLCPMTEFAKR